MDSVIQKVVCFLNTVPCASFGHGLGMFWFYFTFLKKIILLVVFYFLKLSKKFEGILC